MPIELGIEMQETGEVPPLGILGAGDLGEEIAIGLCSP